MSKNQRGRGRTKRYPLSRKSRRTAGSGQQEGTLEDAAFALMDPVYAFDVDVLKSGDDFLEDDTFNTVLFKVGDDVILNSQYDDTDDIWLGQIDQIRASPDRATVMVKVRWYYSRNDVAEHIKSFDLTRCSPYERILSDCCDFVSPYAFQEVTHVHEYHEDSLHPPDIGPAEFFVRTTLNYKRKQIKPPLGADMCICQVAYNPYPSPRPQGSLSGSPLNRSPSPLDRDIMHFCPNLSCRKWYHASCLRAGKGFIDQDAPTATRGLRLLAVDPDNEVPFATFAYFCEQESRSEVMSTDQAVTIFDALIMFDHSPSILAHLPQSLLAIAQSPIVRCSGAPDGWAIGNVTDVVLARRFVYAAIEHAGTPESSAKYLELERLCAHYEDLFYFKSKSKDIDESPKVDEMVLLDELCDGLHEFGILAVPYPWYWDRRAYQFQEAEALLGGPAFVCPSCGSAI